MTDGKEADPELWESYKDKPKIKTSKKNGNSNTGGDQPVLSELLEVEPDDSAPGGTRAKKKSSVKAVRRIKMVEKLWQEGTATVFLSSTDSSDIDTTGAQVAAHSATSTLLAVDETPTPVQEPEEEPFDIGLDLRDSEFDDDEPTIEKSAPRKMSMWMDTKYTCVTKSNG